MNEKPKISIAELENILSSEEEKEIQIQPDGSIIAVPKGTREDAVPVILTAKYAAAEFY